MVCTSDMDKNIDALISRLATTLIHGVIVSQDVCIVVTAWDVYVTSRLAGDACTFDREASWVCTNTANVVIMEHQSTRGVVLGKPSRFGGV